jgi:hypothetical protein
MFLNFTSLEDWTHVTWDGSDSRFTPPVLLIRLCTCLAWCEEQLTGNHVVHFCKPPSVSKLVPQSQRPLVCCRLSPKISNLPLKIYRQTWQAEKKWIRLTYICYVRNSKSRICLCCWWTSPCLIPFLSFGPQKWCICGDSPTISVWTTDFPRFWKRVCLKARHSKSWWFNIIMFHHVPCFSQQKWNFLSGPPAFFRAK